MVINLLDVRRRVVNDVSVTSISLFHTIVIGIIVSDTFCPAGRE